MNRVFSENWLLAHLFSSVFGIGKMARVVGVGKMRTEGNKTEPNSTKGLHR
jgi:hypothetical protein